jgi:hypothetical protein
MLTPQRLQELLPRVVAWVEEQEASIVRHGVPLSQGQVADAIAMGVQQPERVRLLKVDVIGPPDDPALQAAATDVGLFTGTTGGLTLRFGILIQAASWTDRRLIAHELVHVGQYERLGGIQAFLAAYVDECFRFRYPNGPLEQEAILRSGHLGVQR